MGIWDSIKSIGNALTGGAAKVTLEVGTPVKGGPTSVKVSAEVADADLKIDKVYVVVEAVEHVEFKYKLDNSDEEKTFSKIEYTYQQTFEIAGAQTLAGKQKFEFEGTVALPADAPSTFLGKLCKHEWRMYAGLDASGVDPKSAYFAFTL